MQVLYHDEVKYFAKTLQQAARSKLLRGIDLIEQYGHFLTMPHMKKIDTDLYELRIRGQQEIRILFTFQQNNAYLLHGFIKKSQKIPKREIDTAKKRMRLLT
jgi:phage-related protein